MIALIALGLLCGIADDPQLNANQLRDMIREKTLPIRSLIFVYEGREHFLDGPAGPPNRQQFDEELQGTFLYRNDGAAIYDVYRMRTATSSSVSRAKSSFFRGRLEAVRDLIDARQKIGPKNVESSRGLLTSMRSPESPIDLFPVWLLESAIDNFFHATQVEGWETVGGRNCLRVRISVLNSASDSDLDRSQRVFWIDPERNAQVLKLEYRDRGKLAGRIDDIRLSEYPLGDGTTAWLPVHSRKQTFVFGDNYYDKPIHERTLWLVAGSEKLNLNLPDSLFDVRRDAAWPTQRELAGLEASPALGPLTQKFRTQTAPPEQVIATDPVSVRKRIEGNLAEADRQSRELQASSPARETWNWITLIQVVLCVLGGVLLGSMVLRKWRGA